MDRYHCMSSSKMHADDRYYKEKIHVNELAGAERVDEFFATALQYIISQFIYVSIYVQSV